MFSLLHLNDVRDQIKVTRNSLFGELNISVDLHSIYLILFLLKRACLCAAPDRVLLVMAVLFMRNKNVSKNRILSFRILLRKKNKVQLMKRTVPGAGRKHTLSSKKN